MNRLAPFVLAGLASAGCIQFPERDGRWLAMGSTSQEERLLYATRMKTNGTVAGAIGTPIGTVGLIVYVIGLAMIIDPNATTTDMNNGLSLALGGAVVGATGLGIGITGFQSRAKWAEVIAAGASPHVPIFPGGPILPPPPPVPGGGQPQPAPPPVRPPEEPPRRPAGEDLALPDGRWLPAVTRLFLPAGEALPAGGDRCSIVRVSGPGDPVVARLAARVPALRWPVLEAPAPDSGDTTLVVGAEAVAGALARPGRG
ncbi:MAG: hypothetical protein L0216_14850 [Planctomycetales bacterium]|nr:hypothetical protein [Planctomycetales bacterium]